MPTVHTSTGPVRYAVLIPSKGRSAQWAKALAKMPWLNSTDTFLGLERVEAAGYPSSNCTLVQYSNPRGSVAYARERLRITATITGLYDYYVVTDDNAAHKSSDVLNNLVRAAHEYPALGHIIMAGYHNTAVHFDRGKIGKAKTVNGLRSYPGVAMILQCYEHRLYNRYEYPWDSYGLDDRHLALWALKQGYGFRVCMDAPFTKSRYQEGGQGPVEVRAVKTGLAIARLAADFPEYVGAVGTLRIPWQFLLDAREAGGMTANRLVGGAMRKENTLNKKIIVKKRRL